MQPYKTHMLVCTGPRCTQGEGEALFQTIGEKLKTHGLEAGDCRVKRTRCHCFAICKEGPIVVVHPSGTWYERVTPEVMDRILVEHVKEGKVVKDNLYHQA
jgi:(2Fe-2S) ferredoxin